MWVLAGQLVINGLATGFLYALIALGFTLIWRAASVANFAQGDLATLGMFVSLSLHVTLGWPIVPAVLGAIVVASAAGLLTERIVIRPIRKADTMTKLIATLGLSLIVSNGLRLIYGAAPRRFPSFLGEDPITFARLVLTRQNLLISLIVLALIGGLQLLFYRTMMGKALRAVSESQDVAALMGVNPVRMIQLALALSSAMGAFAGVLLAPLIFVSSDISFMLIFKALLGAVIGGFGSYPGALLGGLLVGVLDNLGAFFISTHFRDVISFSILISLLLVRPTGLFGQPIRET